MKTMGREILECFQRGSEALTLFLDMQSRSPAGTTLALTSIGLITTRAISPEIYDLSPARKIVGTNATTQRWNTWGKPWDFRLLRKPIAPNGRARIALGTISVAEEPPKKWSRYIEKTVYDIIDCGPRKQFVVMTGAGPIVAHNCTQATARDLMADAMLRIEKAGPWEIVLSVHDELIAQRKKEGASTLQMFNMLMATTPEWAEGCPIAVEGFSSERYRK